MALLRLRDYRADVEGLLRFLNDIRDLVDPTLPDFTREVGEHSYFKPVSAFYFVLVLQRWEKDGSMCRKGKGLPWRVEVREVPDVDHAEHTLRVSRHILQNNWTIKWQISASELVDERQIIPEHQKALRRSFGLEPMRCADEVFFHDKYRILGT